METAKQPPQNLPKTSTKTQNEWQFDQEFARTASLGLKSAIFSITELPREQNIFLTLLF